MKRDSIYKKIVLFVIMIILLNIAIIKPNAKSKVIEQDLYSLQTEIYNGQKLYLTIRFNRTDSLDKGFNVYKGTLDYDDEVFKEISKNDFVTLNDWEKIEYNKDTKEFIMIKRAGFTDEDDILRISLEVKDNINRDNTEVILKDSIVSNGKKNISLNEDKYQVNLLNRDVVITNNNEINYNSDIDLNKLDIELTNDSVNNYFESKYVLYTILFIFIFFISFVLGYFLLKDFKKIKDIEYNTNLRKFIRSTMFILLGATFLFATNTVQAAFYDFSLKGELKNDGIINYDDVNYLELQVINNDILKDEYLDRADINNDKDVNVLDLSLLIKRLEKKLSYDVILSNVSQDNVFIEKEKEVVLKFKGIVNNEAKISKVKINDNYYDVIEDDSEDGLYSVNIKTNDKAGKIEYKFTEVILNNNKKIKVKFNENFEIIKSMPMFNSYSVNENIQDSLVEMTYELIDNDNAITYSNIQIINSYGDILREYEAKKGINTLKIPITNDELYIAKFNFNYNLTSNKEIDDNNLVGSIEVYKEMRLINDYYFDIGNFRTYSNDIQSNSFKKNEPIKLYFDSYNISGFIPSNIKVNSKIYDVYNDYNGYYAVIDGFDMLGSNTINISSVTLNNGKVFDLKKDNKLIVDITKNIPYISNFTLENDKNNKLSLNFDISNDDNSLDSLIVNIHDNNYYLIKEVKFNSSELNGSKNISKIVNGIDSNTSSYYITIVGNYSLDNKGYNVIENTLFYEGYLTAYYDVSITNSYTDKVYYNKNEDAILTYEIYANDYIDIAKIFINDNTYDVIKIGDGLYQVNYKVKNENGIENILVTGVQNIYGNIFKVSNSQTIEIIKEIPSIENYEDDNDEENITDNNENNDDIEINNISLISGDNSVSFDAKDYSDYKFNVNKDGNSDLLNKDNSGYELVVSTLKNGNVSKYFEKNDKIDVSFYSNNISKDKLESVIINKKKYKLNSKNNAVIVTPNKSGVQAFTIDGVVLKNNKVIDIKSNNKFSYEVLKDIPTLSNYKQTDNIKESKTNVEFTINDNDNSIISGEAILKDQDGSIVNRWNIKNGKNNFTFKVEPEKSYTFEVIVSYDRDIVIDSINSVKNKVLLKKQINGINDYKLIIDNLVTYNDGEESIYFEKGEKINLQFQSSNETNNFITEVTINGKKYNATRSGNKYNVSINGYDKPGVKKYTLEKVKLSNSKEIQIKSNNNFEIEILKDIPKIKDLEVESSDENLNVNVGFKLNDGDKSLLDGEVLFKDSAGNVIDRRQINDSKNNFIFNVDSTGTYLLDVFVTYDRDSVIDDDNRVIECIASKKIDAIKEYKLVIDNIKTYNGKKESRYFNKNDSISVEFNSTNITKYDLSEIMIDGIVYPVKKNNNKYKVELDGLADAGIYDFVIEKVKLSKDVWIDVLDNKIIQIEVLKDAPTVSDYSHTDNVRESISTIEFNLNDSDNSFISGEAILKSSNGSVIKKVNINKDYNIIDFNVEPESVYNLDINVIYDLDSTNDNVNKVSKKLLSKRLTGIKDYKVILENIMTTKDSIYYEKDEKIEINFDSSNITNYDIKEVIVNGKKYKVSNNNNNYTVLVDGINNSGIYKLEIEKVILTNSKSIDIKANNYVEVEVLKDVPSISDYDVSVDGLNVNALFKINDLDKSVVEIEALLKNKDGSVESRKTVKTGTNNIKFVIEPNTSYVIDINATYDRDSVIDKTNVINLSSKDIKEVEDYKLVIENYASRNDNGEKDYFEKNDNVILEFESSNITNKDLSEVTINGKVYKVTKNNKKYSVLLDKISSNGKYTFTLEKVKLTDNTILDVLTSQKVEIEVLKDVPTITNYKESNNIKESKSLIEFELSDQDNSFIEGEVLLKDNNGSVISKKEIKRGPNTIEYDILPESTYSLDFSVTYDRDSTIDNINKSIDKVILRKNLVGIDDYKVTINNLKSINDNADSKYYEKDEDITLKFNSNNLTNYVIEEVVINGKKYKVSRNGESYTVVVNGISKSGVNSLKIEKVKLSNSSEIEISNNNSIDVEILKDEPMVSNFKIEETDDFKVKVSFNLDDKDNSFGSGEVVLLKKDKTVISRKSISANKNNLEFDATSFYDYDLEIRVSYDRDNTNDNINKYSKTLFSKVLSDERDYKVKIDDLKSKKNNSETIYFEKNNNIKLEFTSVNNSSNTIKDITINGKKYNVSRNGNIYTVIVDGYKECGVKTLTIEKVTLSNNVEVEIKDVSIKIDVLKDIPSITSYEEVIDSDNGKAEISFNLSDIDNSLIKAEAVFVKDIDNTKVVKEIKVGKNKLVFDINDIDSYTLNYRLSYDLDSNKISNINNNRVLNKVIQSKNVSTSSEYGLLIFDLKSINNGKDTEYFNKKDKINISFKSTNSNNLEIKSVFINGKEYNVTKNNNNYNVSIEGFDSIGEKIISIDKVKLSNSSIINVRANNKRKIVILKAKPSINNYKIEDNNSSNEVVFFDVNDIDDAMTLGKVEILDKKGKVIEEAVLKKGNNAIVLPKGDLNKIRFTIKYNISSPLDTNKDFVGILEAERNI